MKKVLTSHRAGAIIIFADPVRGQKKVLESLILKGFSQEGTLKTEQ